ncbi:hypothetical protein [Eupransor demetentiae]|uniref:Uncharacterized protein n=1 Tax=Eupransor demetentiae TaxID=3109584 RepID=A0ABP0EMJ3_9LACO|nr:hypothetical protein R54876_GBNLAHCA_00064 [Lactobacillaceae bacterium LMG 33000]
MQSKNKQAGYILVTALIFLGVMALALLSQSIVFGQQIRAQQEANQNTRLETLQILASLHYKKDKKTEFNLKGYQIKIQDGTILLQSDAAKYQRPLLP